MCVLKGNANTKATGTGVKRRQEPNSAFGWRMGSLGASGGGRGEFNGHKWRKGV